MAEGITGGYMPKILAVDDKMDNLITLSALLKNLMTGCAVITARSGPEGIAKAKAERPDVILLDIKMPDMDGFETCRRLMSDESTRRIPVIMITAIKSDTQSRIKGLETGANAFLSKPIDEVELISQVKVALRIKEAEDALRTERDSLERVVEERTTALKEREERFRSLVESTSDWIWAINAEGRYFYTSPQVGDFLGYKPDEVLGKTPFDFMPQKEAERVKGIFQEILKARRPFKGLENLNVKKNGEPVVLETSGIPIFDAAGNFGGYHGVDRDITERKRAEDALRKSEAHYRSLFDNMIEGFAFCQMLFNGDRPLDFIYLDVNSAFETLTGLKNVIGKKVSEVIPGIQESDAELLEIYGRVALSGKSERFERHVKALKMWFSVSVYSSEKDHFVAVFDIITVRKEAEKKLQDTLESLRRAVNTTIQVMVSAVEVRDPYTSGHQLRSADLARAIATEMGLSQDKIDAIRMAGSIHDIGKLSIPAEILSKPTKLSEIEFSLIKAHAQRGFEMLKDVESPWPLAEIVHQHHERMDGSGYPRNLKGDEILLEARILNVADVVEAMASHRPYRPGLGIDAALNEIEKNRGTIYDTAVADACLRLFREKGFQLEGT
jgi:PAS domain S-box-containing protein